MQGQADPFRKFLHFPERLQLAGIHPSSLNNVTPASQGNREPAVQPAIVLYPWFAPLRLVVQAVAIIDTGYQCILEVGNCDFSAAVRKGRDIQLLRYPRRMPGDLHANLRGEIGGDLRRQQRAERCNHCRFENEIHSAILRPHRPFGRSRYSATYAVFRFVMTYRSGVNTAAGVPFASHWRRKDRTRYALF